MVSWGKVTKNPHEMLCCQKSHIISNTQSKIGKKNLHFSSNCVFFEDYGNSGEDLLTSSPENHKLYSVKV